MREGCENPTSPEQKGCNQDQKSFKAYLSRWLTVTSQMVPSTAPNITALLRSSAKAAAAQCNGGPSGTACGIQWDKDGKWDGTEGVGQSMSALEVILGTMIGLPEAQTPKPPVTGDTGGTSVSIPTAGNPVAAAPVTPASKKDKAGAWFITVLIALISLFMIYFMWSDSFENSPSTLAGVAAKGKGRDPEKSGDPERMIIDLHTGKRRSMGNMDAVLAGDKNNGTVSAVSPISPVHVQAGRSATSVTIMPKVDEGPAMGIVNRASIPRYMGGDQVT
jgi:hypothetical protein